MTYGAILYCVALGSILLLCIATLGIVVRYAVLCRDALRCVMTWCVLVVCVVLLYVVVCCTVVICAALGYTGLCYVMLRCCAVC